MISEPDWVQRLRTAIPARLAQGTGTDWVPAPPPDARPAAVLVLLAAGATGPDVLLLERAATLRTHAGQMAFPGGAIDPDDADAVAAALREANEEVELRPHTVTVIGTLAPVWVAPSNFSVVPVIAFWRDPHELVAFDGEVVHIARPSVAELADPHNRYRVQLSNGFLGPAFALNGDPNTRLIWGFTAGVLDIVLRLGGWYRSWNRGKVITRPRGLGIDIRSEEFESNS